MIKSFHEKAWDELMGWLSEDKKTFKRIHQLIRDIERDPFGGIGKPEPLTGDFAGWWSRRIDDKNRIIYQVKGDMLVIAQCGGHYGDK